MKILGKTGPEYSDDFIVQLTANEIANIYGKYWYSADNFKLPKVGDQLDIPEFYHCISEFIGTKDVLKEFTEKLKRLVESAEKLI